MSRFVHAYKQAPWRTQRQIIGIFLLAVVLVAMVAGIYLNISARAALAGREIQVLEREIETTRRKIADLETELAVQMSTSVMKARAEELGFVPVTAGEVEYVPVPGYFPPQPVVFAAAARTRDSAPIIIPAFTQSLFEWLEEQMRSAAGVQP